MRCCSMGKTLLRSKDRKQIISVSVDDKVLNFLDKQPNKSRFICELVRKAMEEEQKPLKEEIREPAKPELKWTEEMNRLWNIRSNFMIHLYGKFEKLEDQWLELKFGDSGYVEEEEDWQKAIAEFKPEVAEYFDKVLALRPPMTYQELAAMQGDDYLILYLDRIEEEKQRKIQADLRHQYGGDPEEVIWQGRTRQDIMMCFKKDEHYTVQDVASELGISYDQAYKHIVPWLKAQGIQVGN